MKCDLCAGARVKSTRWRTHRFYLSLLEDARTGILLILIRTLHLWGISMLYLSWQAFPGEIASVRWLSVKAARVIPVTWASHKVEGGDSSLVGHLPQFGAGQRGSSPWGWVQPVGGSLSTTTTTIILILGRVVVTSPNFLQVLHFGSSPTLFCSVPTKEWNLTAGCVLPWVLLWRK